MNEDCSVDLWEPVCESEAASCIHRGCQLSAILVSTSVIGGVGSAVVIPNWVQGQQYLPDEWHILMSCPLLFLLFDTRYDV